MRRFKTIFFAVLLGLIGFALVAFNGDESSMDSTNNNAFLFSVHSDFLITNNINRTISLSALQAGNRLRDIIDYYPEIEDDRYESVWVKSLFGDEDISLMNRSEVLSPEQKALLAKAKIGSFYEVVINYNEDDDPELYSISHKRVDYNLTVVPEREAHYPGGNDQLKMELEEQFKKEWGDKKLEKMPSISIKFTIDKEGKVGHINQKGKSDQPEIDELAIELLQGMKTWIPAEDAQGNRVEQTFQLISGTPGC